MIELSKEFKNISAFNCQQGVEKAIKGFLVFHGVRPPKTHSIKELAKFVEPIDAKLVKKLTKAEILTKYAVVYRYPDAEKKPLTLKQVNSAIKLSNQLFELLRKAVVF